MTAIGEIIQVMAVAVFVMFLPGYMMTLLLVKDRNVDMVERMVLAFTLSVSVVPLLILYANMLGLTITPVSVLVLIFIFTNLVYLVYKLTEK